MAFVITRSSRRFLLTSCALAVSIRLIAASIVPPVVADQLMYLPPGSTQIGGHLGQQMQLCLDHRVLAQDAGALIKPFVAREDVTEWRGEFWGKWITSAIAAYRNAPSPQLKQRIDETVAELEATRTPDGYIGTYAPANRLQRWDVWSRKYTMLGLIGWYDAGGDNHALEVARGIADGIIADAAAAKGTFFQNDMWNGMATSSVLEPLVLLYLRTGDSKYLDFCRWLLAEWQKPTGPDLLRKALAGTPVFKMFPGPDPSGEGYAARGHSKAYEMMSCYEGLVELYRATGEPSYAEAAKAVYRNIRDTEITVIGSGSDWERWSDGRRHQADEWKKGMETCVTVTWMKLSGQLLRLTGDSSYADEIELATYNALLGAQSPDGSWWAHHSPLAGTKERAPEQCDMSANCCVANGPRALLLLPELAVFDGREGPVVNLFGQMNTTVSLVGKHTVRLAQKSDYPASGEIHLTVTPDATIEFALTLRIPAWSQKTSVAVNGVAEPNVQSGHYFAIKRTWKPGDVVTLSLDMEPRVLEAPGQPGHFALMRGPLVLARDARLGSEVDTAVAFDFSQPNKITVRPLPGDALPAVWLAFEALDAKGKTLRLCDFASAGNTWSQDSRYRVWSQSQ
jgi:DUF1680 family protein